jgi:hypothetical protein
MDDITLSVVIGEDRRLVVDLPEDAPTGPVELVIRAVPVGRSSVGVESIDKEALHAERERARQKLLAAGLLATDLGIPDNLESLSDEELEQLVRLPSGARPSEELIDEDRGLY